MNNEEKILAGLDEIKEVLKEHSEILKEHGEILHEHTAILKEHSEILKDHSRILQEHSETMGRMQTELTKVAITQENVVLPQLRLLAEGQQTLMDTLAPKNRVEALEDEVGFMKTVLKALSQEVAELKKAQ